MAETTASGREGGVITSSARQQWLAVLAKAPLADLEAAWDALADKPAYRVLRRSETGLVMVRGRIGGTGDPLQLWRNDDDPGRDPSSRCGRHGELHRLRPRYWAFSQAG